MKHTLENKVKNPSAQAVAPLHRNNNRQSCSRCRKKQQPLQRLAVNNSAPSLATPIVHEVVRSPGQPLDPATRVFMESRFSHEFSRKPIHLTHLQASTSGLKTDPANDIYEQEAKKTASKIMQISNMPEGAEPPTKFDFSNVRIHTDRKAAKSAQAVNARAYTVTNDVVFASKRYSPETREGQRLLAHELTHVIQQRSSSSALQIMRLSDEEKQDNLKSARYAGNLRLENAYDNNPPLGIGESGEAVRLVQEGLVADGFYMPASTKPEAEMDGIFGGETASTVKKFQSKYGLNIDGRVGRQTMGKLDDLAMEIPPGECILPQVAACCMASEEMKKQVAKHHLIYPRLDSGRYLDNQLKSRMESAFSSDFSHVRVHTGAAAAGLSNELNARAFTVGRDVAFADGEFRPGTLLGDALIAHELAHVLQQGRTDAARSSMQKNDGQYDALEEDANQSALSAVTSLWNRAKGAMSNVTKNAVPQLRSGLRLSRCPGCSSPQVCNTAPHPVNLHTMGQLVGSLNYGYTLIFTFESSTGKKNDLKGCKISEHLKYSKIPNPPYGESAGNAEVSESGREERINEKPAESLKGTDRHRCPAEWFKNPPSKGGSYTVTQTYDYRCPACGSSWIPFANYLITSEVYVDKDDGKWKHKMLKEGSGVQAGESFPMIEDIK